MVLATVSEMPTRSPSDGLYPSDDRVVVTDQDLNMSNLPIHYEELNTREK